MILLSLLLGLAIEAVAQEVDKSGQPIVRQSINVNDAVATALRENPTLASRKAAIAAAAARVGAAKSMTRLQVAASVFGSTGNMPMVFPGPAGVQPQNFSLTSDKPRIDQNLMAMYPLYTGGKLTSQVSSARSLQRASSLDALTAELDVTLAVKTAYYQVMLARAFVDAYQRRTDEARERVRIAEESFAGGRIAKYDLLRNQTDLAEARQQTNNAGKDVDMALAELKNVMGVSQSSELTLTQDLAFQPCVWSIEDLQAAALKQRSEIAAARAKVQSAQADQQAAEGGYRPQVYATAMTDLGAQRDGTFDKGYLVGIAAALPILDGGLRKSNVEEAKAMVAQAKADERQATLGVSRDVASAFAQADAAAKNVVLAQASVTQAEEDYRVIKMRYEAGKATNVEVLDALASLTRARTNHAEALYQYSLARETLARATGQR